MLVLVLLVSAACSDRRSFDDKYEDTAREMDNRARSLDAELNTETPSNANLDKAPSAETNSEALVPSDR